MRQLLKKIIPFWIRDATRPLRDRIKYRGNARYCPVCDGHAAKFLSNKVFGVMTDDVVCPWCESHERHRFLWRYFQLKTDVLETIPGRTMLHVAPEKSFVRPLRKSIGGGYVTADLLDPFVDVTMDIADIHYPDDHFNFIYCSHVLQYVKDDLKALSEFRRVLKPGGWAIINVPIRAEKTGYQEDSAFPEDSVFLVDKSERMRLYGPDYLQRLESVSFTVECIRPKDLLSDEEIVFMGLNNPEVGEIYLCRK